MQPTEVDFGRLSVGAAASTALALLEEELKDLNAKIDQVIFHRIDEGTLTGEIAMMAFARKHALMAVFTRLAQKVKIGQSSAKRLAQQGV